MKKKFLLLAAAAIVLFTAALAACNPPPSPGSDLPQADAAKLIINQIYGRGIEDGDILTDSPVSHSFVELYYSGEEDASLNGYSLYAGYNTSNGSFWNGHLRLTGTVKPGHSFLVAVTQATNAPSARYKITPDKIDQVWPGTAFNTGGFGSKVRIGFNNKNLKVLLRKSSDPLPAGEKNPFVSNNGEKISGYVDMLSMSASDYQLDPTRDPVDAFEGTNGTIASQSRNKAIRRKNFSDTNNTYADTRAIDYRAHHLTGEGLNRYRPRSIADGAWENYDDTRPEHVIINQVYGKSTETESALSNSFIELYNPTETAVSLNGKSLQFSAGGTMWEKLEFGELDVIPANSSFLVVFLAERNDAVQRKINLEKADKVWETAALPNQNLKVALMDNADTLSVVNPSSHASVKDGCIDFIGVSGSNTDGAATPGIDAWQGEGTKAGLSKQKSVRRKFFAATGQNMDDLEFIDYRPYDGDEENGITDARMNDPLLGVWPKCREDGAWGILIR